MKVKVCPFCGSKPSINSQSVGTPYEAYFIRCTNPKCEAEIRNPFPTGNKAANAWNKRIENEDIVELIDIPGPATEQIIDYKALEEFAKEASEKFGEKSLWGILFLLGNIDINTWTFPDNAKITNPNAIISYIENSELLRNVFKKTEP